MSLVLFDVLYVGGKSVMREPWRDRRKRLEDLIESHQLPRIAVVPVTEDAPTLYETWVGMAWRGHREPPRLSRRLQTLRGWGHAEADEVFAGSAGASGADGGGT
jgi:ATP dependent DNA ligase domain